MKIIYFLNRFDFGFNILLFIGGFATIFPEFVVVVRFFQWTQSACYLTIV